MVKAKVLESRYVFADRWLRLRSDRVLLPGVRLPAPCTIFEYPDWVDVIALTGDRNVVLVDQYRHAVGQIRTEFPAGMVDEAEEPIVATGWPDYKAIDPAWCKRNGQRLTVLDLWRTLPADKFAPVADLLYLGSGR